MIRIASVAATPIPIDSRPPSAVRVSRSRPNWSVPKGCARLEVWLLSVKSILFGSYGETTGQIRQ
jgi:hypothetical protein